MMHQIDVKNFLLNRLHTFTRAVLMLLFVIQTQFVKAEPTSNLRIVDSLEKELKLHSREDTTRILLLIALADFHKSADRNKSELYLSEALRLSTKKSYSLGLGKAQFVFGKLNHLSNDLVKALSFYRLAGNNLLLGGDISSYSKCKGFQSQALQAQNNSAEALVVLQNAKVKVDQSSDRDAQFIIYSELATIYENNSQSRMAVPLLQKCIAFAKELKNENFYIIAINNLGNSLESLGEFNHALNYLFEALEYFSKDKNSAHFQGVIHNNIGKLYGGMQDWKSSEYHFIKAYNLHDAQQDPLFSIKLKGNLGHVFIQKKSYDSAMLWINEALDLSLKSNYAMGVAKYYHLLGEAFFGMRDFTKAKQAFIKAMNLHDQLGPLSSRISVREDFSDLYSEIGEFQKASNLLIDALTIAKELKSNKVFAKLYASFYKLESLRGNFKEALAYHVLYKTYSDSMLDEEKLKSMENFRAQYELKEKDREITDNQERIALQKKIIIEQKKGSLFLILGGILILLVTTIFTVYWVQRNKNLSKTRELKSKIYALQSQINPHFIFNSLASIHGYMLSQKTDAAADYVIKFSKLMRQILEHTRNEFVDLAAELEILRMYLDLEKERSSHRFHYVLNIEDSVDLHEALLPPMLIQPFVENAIWHGLIPSQGTKGQIQIDIYRESETLLCTVEDNGVGLNEDFSLDKLQKDSHGIQLVLDRINLLNEKSRAKGSVSLENTQSGVRVKLVIPLV